MASTVTQLAPGLMRQYVCGQAIAAFRVLTAQRDTIDAWIAACDEEMERAARHQRPILLLQDLRADTFAPTPYSNERGAQMTNAYPELKGRIAMLITTSRDDQRVDRFVKRLADPTTRQRRVFTEAEFAVEWLAESLYVPCKLPELLWEFDE